jgi:hypothetical protein
VDILKETLYASPYYITGYPRELLKRSMYLVLVIRAVVESEWLKYEQLK